MKTSFQTWPDPFGSRRPNFASSANRRLSARNALRALLLSTAFPIGIAPFRNVLADVNSTWTNADHSNNLWTDASNWNPATEPNNGNGGNNFIVEIPSAPGAADVSGSVSISIDSLTVDSSAQLN